MWSRALRAGRNEGRTGEIGCDVVDDASITEQDDPVGQRGEVRVVGDHDGGHPPRAGVEDHPHHHLAVGRVERTRWFVGEEELALADHGPSASDTLALPTGQLVGVLVEPLGRLGHLHHAQDLKGALAGLKGDQSFIGEMVKAFAERRTYMYDRLTKIPGVTCVKPMGAFYMLPNISSFGLDSTKFSTKLLDDQKVAVVPGIAFGSDAHVRLSYACSMENIQKGLDRIEAFCAGLK